MLPSLQQPGFEGDDEDEDDDDDDDEDEDEDEDDHDDDDYDDGPRAGGGADGDGIYIYIDHYYLNLWITPGDLKNVNYINRYSCWPPFIEDQGGGWNFVK